MKLYSTHVTMLHIMHKFHNKLPKNIATNTRQKSYSFPLLTKGAQKNRKLQHPPKI